MLKPQYGEPEDRKRFFALIHFSSGSLYSTHIPYAIAQWEPVSRCWVYDDRERLLTAAPDDIFEWYELS